VWDTDYLYNNPGAVAGAGAAKDRRTRSISLTLIEEKFAPSLVKSHVYSKFD
jgi:hypothetical protein